MKRIIFVFFLFFLTITSKAQQNNFFPLKEGSIWLYHESGYSNHDGYFASIDTAFIIKDTTVENIRYFKLSDYASDWIRYNETENKVYILWNDTEYVFIDFNVDKDSSYAQFLPYYHTSVQATSIKTSENIFGNMMETCGYESVIRSGNSVSDNEFKYAENFGLVGKSQYQYTVGPGGYFDSYASLIQYVFYDSLSIPHFYSHSYNPEIIFKPDSCIKDSVFNLNFQINDHFSAFTGRRIFNFIDSVRLESYYQKGNIAAENKLENIPNSMFHQENYDFEKSINLKLMKEGYNFKYKIIAKDRGIIPHYSSSPDTGYYSLKYDSTLSDVRTNKTPENFYLSQNFPNPFNPSTSIKFMIPKTSFVILKIFDVLGREVETLVNEEKPAGLYKIEFSAVKLSSGVYFYKIEAGDFMQIRKMIFLK